MRGRIFEISTEVRGLIDIEVRPQITALKDWSIPRRSDTLRG